MISLGTFINLGLKLALFFFLLVYLSTKWNESYIREFYFTPSFFISAIVSKEFASGSYGKWSKQPSILAG